MLQAMSTYRSRKKTLQRFLTGMEACPFSSLQLFTNACWGQDGSTPCSSSNAQDASHSAAGHHSRDRQYSAETTFLVHVGSACVCAQGEHCCQGGHSMLGEGAGLCGRP